MELYAVINGDIIDSTKMSVKSRDEYLTNLKAEFESLKKDKSLGLIRSFEMYRGDSFQVAINKPEKALRLVLRLRSFSRMNQATTYKVNTTKKRVIPSSFDIADLRLSVGIGKVTKISTKLMESDGEAFHLSGRLIDGMKKSGLNLAITTPSKDLNYELDASWGLIDALVSKWTSSQAQAVYHSLKGNTQIDIANKVLRTSPSAVNQRLRLANWSAMEKMIQYFEDVLITKLK